MSFAKRFLRLSIGIAVLSAIGTSSFANANETKKGHSKDVDKKDVPAAVMAAFEKAYPKAAVKEIEKKTDSSGTVFYEIESKSGKNKIEAVYTIDGTMTKVEEVVPVNNLPEAVTKSVSTAYPRTKITEAEKVVHGLTVEYEIDVVTGKEKNELLLDETGKVLSAKKETGDKEENETGDDHGQKDKEKE
jgi:hypothetical protein